MVELDPNELDKIIMECKDEPSYNPPENMINENGKRDYAYVTLIMMGDKYIPAAVVLAYSIRELNSNCDLVVMITKDVSEKGKNILGSYFDLVLKVPYIFLKTVLFFNFTLFLFF